MKSKSLMGARIYISSVAVLLTLTAFAKLVSITGHAPILSRPDPLLLMANSNVLLLVAVLELLIAGYLVFGNSLPAKCLLVAWLSANFVVYRIALELVAPGRPCACLGRITGQLPIDERTVNLLLKATIVYFLLGSIWLFFADTGLFGCVQQARSQKVTAPDNGLAEA